MSYLGKSSDKFNEYTDKSRFITYFDASCNSFKQSMF